MPFKGPRPDSYDEVHTAEGALRAPYAELQRRFGFDVLRPPPVAIERLRDRPFGDDVRILPVPWVLDRAEYSSVVQAGVRQRSRALQAFFADVVIGPGQFVGSQFAGGQGSLTSERLDTILELEGTSRDGLRSLWEGHRAEEIRFVYGPDLVRDTDGHWLVLEDNVGCIGGSADSACVWSLYVDAVGGPTDTSPSVEPDLRLAVRLWLERLGMTAGDEVLAVAGCESGGDDLSAVLIHENARRRLLLDPLGVEVAESGQFRGLLEAGARGGRTRAILNFHPGSELIDEAFRQGAALFNAPGTGILGNKALLPHVDDMIRFFCHEEPLLATPPTHVLDGGALPSDPDDWVVKSAAGCQGTEVFVLRAQPPGRLAAIRDLVRRGWPRMVFVAQRRVEPSHLATAGPGSWDTQLVELRPVTYVLGWSDVHVSVQPSGKAVSSFDARRQNNISRGACYVPVTAV